MKTMLIAFALAVTFLNVKGQTAQIPSTIQSQFKSVYPKAATVEWQQVNDKYKVMFTDLNNLHHTIIYQKDGKVFSRESELDEQAVPKPIRDYYVENFPNEASYRVWKLEDESEKITYYSPVKDAVIFFDKDGKFVRRDERTPENMNQH